jgi:hypothetical protein
MKAPRRAGRGENNKAKISNAIVTRRKPPQQAPKPGNRRVFEYAIEDGPLCRNTTAFASERSAP